MPPPRPLAGPDARILQLLTDGVSFDRTCDVGRHHRSWRPSDVHRVACTWLHPEQHKASRPRPQPQRAPEPQQPTRAGARTVELTERRAAIFAELLAGRRMKDAAANLGLSTTNIANTAKRIANDDFDAVDWRQAVAWVRSGEVAVAVKVTRRG